MDQGRQEVSEAQEFLQPFIDSNCYWIHKCIIVGLLMLILTIVLLAMYKIVKDEYCFLEIFLGIGSMCTGLISFGLFLSAFGGKCENIQMTKFPQAEYNKIRRSIRLEPLDKEYIYERPRH